ncbi:hypothetical protein G6F35_016033 [Rhizopus arrhizus]|nr:hypothetical protein G6F35_016033 [Rhizopus arrhizus]
MHVVGRQDQLFRARAHFLAHAVKARAARLQVGDADHVVVGHGRGHVAGRGTGQRPLLGLTAVSGVQVAQRLHAAQVVGGAGKSRLMVSSKAWVLGLAARSGTAGTGRVRSMAAGWAGAW